MTNCNIIHDQLSQTLDNMTDVEVEKLKEFAEALQQAGIDCREGEWKAILAKRFSVLSTELQNYFTYILEQQLQKKETSGRG